MASSGNFTLREPTIEPKTSTGVAVGISIAFAAGYMVICMMCMVRRLRLNKATWTTATNVPHAPSAISADGASLPGGQSNTFTRTSSAWSRRSTNDGMFITTAMQPQAVDQWSQSNGPHHNVRASTRSRVSHLSNHTGSPVQSQYNIEMHSFRQ